jgi:hypothetical protein
VVADSQIVGVVKSFHDFALRREEPEVFFAFFAGKAKEGAFYVRSRAASMPAMTAMRSIRSEMRRLDPALTVLSLRTVDDQLDRMLTNERLLATLAGAFAAGGVKGRACHARSQPLESPGFGGTRRHSSGVELLSCKQ